MQISDLGEFGLIELVRGWTESETSEWEAAGYRLTVANGDDAAAVTFPAGAVTELYTTDTMVEGAHFTAETMSWRDLGWKAVASNISDVAAMGGEPVTGLITLGLPATMAVDDVAELYAGMMEICGEFVVRIIGGDMVRSPVAFVTVALTGVCSGSPMVRTGAEPGHLVGVTGPVGGAAGGLRQLLANDGRVDFDGGELVQRHRRPSPHIAAGRALVAGGVGCAMDVSDGLADDLGKLCSASGVSAQIHAAGLPALPALKAAFPDEWLDLALYGGEDYVLLFTAPEDIMDAVMTRLPSGAAVIGEIKAGEPGTVVVLDEHGVRRNGNGAGWDHFAG